MGKNGKYKKTPIKNIFTAFQTPDYRKSHVNRDGLKSSLESKYEETYSS